MAEKKQKTKKEEIQKSTSSNSQKVLSRGRIFEGIVTRKFPKRITIEFDRTIFIQKYQRFLNKTTRIHARLPEVMESEIHLGDLVRVQECRPLSKIIHHIVIQKVKSNGAKNDS